MATLALSPLKRATLPEMINTTQGIAIFITGFVFTCTAALSFVLRCWAKKLRKHPFFVEDWLCLGSLVCVIGIFICLTLHIQLGGVGHHFADLPPQDLSYTLQILVAYQTLYALAVGAVKTSICHFYIRIFFSAHRPNRLIAYGVIGFIWSWVIMSILVAFLSCTPFEFTWNPMLPGGHCDNQIGSFVAEAVLDLIADIMVLVLPLRPIYRLHTTRAKKTVLFVIFGLGLSTMAMAILRIVGLAELSYMDFQYTSPTPIIATLLEPAIGISVACIPLLQPVFQNTWLGRRLGANSKQPYNPRYQQKGSARFQRVGDELPLNPRVKPGDAVVTISAMTSDDQMDAPSQLSANGNGNGIYVQRGFSTYSTRA